MDLVDSATYIVHLVSIIDAILRRVEDNVSKHQLELLKQVGECLKIQNKDKLFEIINELKGLE